MNTRTQSAVTSTKISVAFPNSPKFYFSGLTNRFYLDIEDLSMMSHRSWHHQLLFGLRGFLSLDLQGSQVCL